MPRSNNFKIGIGDNCVEQLSNVVLGEPGDQWTERQKTITMDFFTENDLEKCGSTMIQDEFGIVYELHVKGNEFKKIVLCGKKKYLTKIFLREASY